MLHPRILPSFQRSNTKEAEGVQKLHEIVCNIQTMGFLVQISICQRKLETPGIKAVSNHFLLVSCH